jgi:L-serine dehydratase
MPQLCISTVNSLKFVLLMEKFISVFDMFKIGVGPSSSHTLGPWLAAKHMIQRVGAQSGINHINALHVYLYGSLAKTGKGHGTDTAILMGLQGEDPVTTDTRLIAQKVQVIKEQQTILLDGVHSIKFDYNNHLVFLKDKSLPYHPNAMQFVVELNDTVKTFTYYSVGGGFIETEASEDGLELGHLIEDKKETNIEVPFNFFSTNDLIHWCIKTGLPISDIVRENEKQLHTEQALEEGLNRLWKTMMDCIYKGVHAQGILPGGLQVHRRAFDLNAKLLKKEIQANQSNTESNVVVNDESTKTIEQWMQQIQSGGSDFTYILDWVSCFALAVNEENASFGRVVTAPTNGAAGVIPAVLMYAINFCNKGSQQDIHRFLLTANAIGILFKNGATISAAMGGCQAEIGVSSAMAAAGLTELLGGNQRQVLMAGEIAMEHHLGLTCDPVGGLVQIPCIERNTMGAIKAITAAQLALQSKPDYALVSLDKVIHTMWQTALDMNVKYKETADGGLAMQIPIGLAEC